MKYQENNKRTTTTTTTGGSTGTTTVDNCQIMVDEQLIRNRAQLLREKYADTIGQEMTRALLRQLLLALIEGTPWQYYDYALDEAAYAPAPSWRYVMAIVNRLVNQAVPVERLRDPRSKRQSTKTVEHQNYTQRDYYHTEDAMDRMMAAFMEGR